MSSEVAPPEPETTEPEVPEEEADEEIDSAELAVFFSGDGYEGVEDAAEEGGDHGQGPEQEEEVMMQLWSHFFFTCEGRSQPTLNPKPKPLHTYIHPYIHT